MPVVSSDMITTVLGIALIDLILGGDNALVIAMASRSLPAGKRRVAVIWGTAGAVGLRLLFAGAATALLGIPYLMLAGGILLMWISYKLLVGDPHHVQTTPSASVVQAVRVIVAADAVMSLDNALAIAGIAGGNLYWLAFGIAFSVPIIVWGSHGIAAVMRKYPVIVYLGAAVLAWTAGKLMAQDPLVHKVLGPSGPWLIGAIGVVLVVLTGYVKRPPVARNAKTH